MGKRIHVVLLIGQVIFVLEFKVGETTFSTSAVEQVYDYALDLKNFHETSYYHFIAPVLIAIAARRVGGRCLRYPAKRQTALSYWVCR